MQPGREGIQGLERKIVRRRGACDSCKQRKIRCMPSIDRQVAEWNEALTLQVTGHTPHVLHVKYVIEETLSHQPLRD